MLYERHTCSLGDLGLIPGLGRSPGAGHGNPLQYSCLENPHGQKSMAGYSPWGHKESDMAERLSTAQHKGFLRFDLSTLCIQSQSQGEAFQMEGIEETDMQNHSSYMCQHCLGLLICKMGVLGTYECRVQLLGRV